MLKENLTQVEEKIDAACRRAGRDRSEVTLIAVSKPSLFLRLRKPMISASVYLEKTRCRSW